MRTVRRMPRLQVYLPDELTKRGLPASELLQIALRAELERQDALDETSRYLEDSWRSWENGCATADPGRRNRTTHP